MASTSFALSHQIPGRRFSAVPALQTVNFRQTLRISARYATAERASAGNASHTASFYQVLGIQTGATCQEIKSAYRKLARVLHPDVASSYGDENRSSADDFMRVHAAYATLSDPEKRAVYDTSLSRRRQTAVLSTATDRGMRWETDQCW